MRGAVDVALALAYRQLTVLLKNPSLFLPPMLFPLVNFACVSRAGSRGCATFPDSTFHGGYTAFVFVFVLLQSAAFGGVFAGLRDRARLRARVRAAPARLGAESQRDHPRLRPRRAGSAG